MSRGGLYPHHAGEWSRQVRISLQPVHLRSLRPAVAGLVIDWHIPTTILSSQEHFLSLSLPLPAPNSSTKNCGVSGRAKGPSIQGSVRRLDWPWSRHRSVIHWLRGPCQAAQGKRAGQASAVVLGSLHCIGSQAKPSVRREDQPWAARRWLTNPVPALLEPCVFLV